MGFSIPNTGEVKTSKSPIHSIQLNPAWRGQKRQMVCTGRSNNQQQILQNMILQSSAWKIWKLDGMGFGDPTEVPMGGSDALERLSPMGRSLWGAWCLERGVKSACGWGGIRPAPLSMYDRKPLTGKSTILLIPLGKKLWVWYDQFLNSESYSSMFSKHKGLMQCKMEISY